MMTVRIFLVDNEPAVPKLVTIYLKSLLDDFEIMTSNSGENAVERILLLIRGGYHEKIPDITILDLKMPGMGGLEAATKLSLMGIENIYILTAYLSPDLIEEAQKAGVKGIMQKSEGFKEVAQKIADIAHSIHPS
ncbi:MAG: response regulator [Candidatus Thorarchaeota archaeon]|nr:response regulator [Candidatus Thorarchaeota archaeon]